MLCLISVYRFIQNPCHKDQLCGLVKESCPSVLPNLTSIMGYDCVLTVCDWGMC